MLVFIDKDYKCHTKNLGNYRLVNVPYFDNKCETFIEGFRYIPDGETYQKETGEIITGRALVPFKDLILLESIQRSYDEFLIYKQDFDDRIKQLNDDFLEYKRYNENKISQMSNDMSNYKNNNDNRISQLSIDLSNYKDTTNNKLRILENHTH